ALGGGHRSADRRREEGVARLTVVASRAAMVGLLPFSADDQRDLVSLASLRRVCVCGIDDDEEVLTVTALPPNAEFYWPLLQFAQIGVAALGHCANILERNDGPVEIAENF